MTQGAPPPLNPHSLAQALWRGGRGHCPRCDQARLFAAWLKPVTQCPACG